MIMMENLLIFIDISLIGQMNYILLIITDHQVSEIIAIIAKVSS